jgi:hypothetical protein
MYPGSLLATLAGFTLLGVADVKTGTNRGVSGVRLPLLCAPNSPTRYSRRHLNSMLALSP